MKQQAQAARLAQWLYRLENRHAKEIQLGLARVSQVAKRLDIDEFAIPVITVAGTNGKGSTIAMLEAIYVAAGYQVASYTSPHLFHFNERICINRQPISDDKLCDLFDEIEQSRQDIHLTYFEVATLAALLYFKRASLDVVLLEVGMGGRLDATNIIDADVSIITTIDLDHQAYLGATREAIGFEKAGIMRTHGIAIFADDNPPLSIIEHAKSLKTPLYQYKRDYDFKEQGETSLFDDIVLPTPKIHPQAAAAALFAAKYLDNRLPVSKNTWSNACKTVTISGRQQLTFGHIPTLFDVAHNPQSISALAVKVASIHPKGKIYTVFSALEDKDLPGLITPLTSMVDQWFTAPLDCKRAADQVLLEESFQDVLGYLPKCYSDIHQAYAAACRRATPDDLIIVYGSFFTVSALMPPNDDLSNRRKHEAAF